jgi:predicted transposase/invertase (TIGR01784 family)
MSDLIYRVKLRKHDLYIVILLEFKSTPSRFVVLQILGYVVDFWRHLVETNKKLKKLPPVFPVMLYNGKKHWTSPVNISELVDGNELLGKYAVHFGYFPIIESNFAKEELLRIENIVSTLFLAETQYDLELLTSQLIRLFEEAADKQAVSLFMNWLKQLTLHEKIEESDYHIFEKIYTDKTEVNMLIESIRKEKKQLRNEGIKEAKLQIAKKMLTNNEPFERVMFFTGLSEKQLLKLKAILDKN